MTERGVVNKSSRFFARPLRDLLGKVVGETFARRGFASAELVTRWTEIVGADIAAHSEPIKIQWSGAASRSATPGQETGGQETGGQELGMGASPGILVLRVEGPAAVEIQHLAGVICERVNRFLGWRAVERIALRQAPLRGSARPSAVPADAAAAALIAAGMPEIADEDLRHALGRLGAAVRRR